MMSYDEAPTDLDLYTDFLEGETSEDNEARDNDRRFTELQEKYENQIKICDELRQRNEVLEKKNETLMINLTKLFKTARKEIYVKNKELKHMRERLDNIIFRRTSKLESYANSQSCRRNNSKTEEIQPTHRNNNEVERKTNIQSEPKINFQRESSAFSPQIINLQSKQLLNYYKNSETKPRDKKLTSTNIDNNFNELKSNRTKNAGTNVDKNTLKHKMKEIATSQEQVKNKLENKLTWKKRRQDCDNRSEVINREDKKLGENKDVEDGEILSDTETTSKRIKKRERDQSEKDHSKPNVNSQKNVKSKQEYLRQLEVNRMKMQVRREKILLVKAQEDLHRNNKVAR